MSCWEDNCINMLRNFRARDLQVLLRTFCSHVPGPRSKLEKRAIKLLRTKPVGLNYEAYIAKIWEISTSTQNDTPNNDISHNTMPNQKQQPLASVDKQQTLSSNIQESMHIQRDGSPPIMLQIQRGINENNNFGTYNNNIQNIYQFVDSHNNTLSLDPLNQVEKVKATNYTTCDLKNANSFNPTTQSPGNFKLKKIPFYEIFHTLVEPTILVGHEECSLLNYTKGKKEESFEITLTPKQATTITMNRDISDGKNEYIYQIQIRICKFEDGYTEITDFLPSELYIRVNNKVCPLPSMTNSHLGTEAKRIAKPIYCAELFKLSPIIPNKICVNWTPDGNTYIFALYLVKNLTADELLKKLYNKERRSSEDTKNYIIRKLADVDSDLSTTSYRFSLVCPLGKIRMKTPAKSKNCDHLRCFDASTFILMNEKKSTWTCPTCNQPCLYDDLQIESYFLEIVESPSLPDECNEIEILADGTWRVYEENKEPTGSTTYVEEKPKDFVHLVNSNDENFMEVKNVPNELEKFKSPTVDLTISDDENSTEEKNKSNPDGSSKESENLKSFFSEWTFGDDE